MPRRQRWTPVKGTGNRVYDPLERIGLGAALAAGRALFALARVPSRADRATLAGEVREILVLRLDRIGDVLMSFPALARLRATFPAARIRLAVGAWSALLARRAPVDDLLVWSAPWAGRRSEGAHGYRVLAQEARARRADGVDLAIDLQGDVRANALLALTGARLRVGYANTGGRWLLTHVVPLDETVSWVEQNRRAVAVAAEAAGAATPAESAPVGPLAAGERESARRRLAGEGLARGRPLVGLHPSGGRAVKQWDLARWAEVASRLQREFGATIVVTGSAADRPLAAVLAAAVPALVDLTGRLDLTESLATIAALDLFLSPDTGPMHMACATGTPSVSVFGPSDPVRYFSGGTGAPGTRHVVVRADLWCAPCNLIRKPPAECRAPEGPECLRLVTAEAVYEAAARLLRETGHGSPPAEVPA